MFILLRSKLKNIINVVIVIAMFFSCMTSNIPIAKAAPAAPSDVTAVPIGNSNVVKMTWTDNSSDETKFQVGYTTSTYYTTKDVPADSTTYDLAAGESTTYKFGVRSCISYTCSAWIEVPNITTGLKTPTNLKAEPCSGQLRVVLSWEDQSSKDAKYYVERSLLETSGFFQIAELPANSKYYADESQLAWHSPYFYRVRFSSATGMYSDYSNVAGINMDRDGTNREFINTLPISPNGNNLFTFGNFSYVYGDPFLKTVDLSQPDRVVKGTLKLPGLDFVKIKAAGDNNFLYLSYANQPATNVYEVNFLVISIIDKENPVLVSKISWPNKKDSWNQYPTVVDIDFKDNLVFISQGRNGLLTVDITNQYEPVMASTFTDGMDPAISTSPSFDSIIVSDDRVYSNAIMGSDKMIFVFDDNTSLVTPLKKISGRTDCNNFINVKNNRAYCPDNYDNLKLDVLEVSDLNNIRLVDSMVADNYRASLQEKNMRWVGDNLLLQVFEPYMDGDYKITVYKYALNDLHTLIESGNLIIPSEYYGTGSTSYFISNERLLYAGTVNVGSFIVYIGNLSNLQLSPLDDNQEDTPGIIVNYPYLYAVKESMYQVELLIYDISDSLKPYQIARKQLYKHDNPDQYDHYVYEQAIRYFQNHLIIINDVRFFTVNVENPANPIILGNITLPSTVYDMAIAGDKAFLTSESADSIQKIDISNLSSPQLQEPLTIANSRTGRIKALNNNIYLATAGYFQAIDPFASPPVVLSSLSGSFSDFDIQGDFAYVGKGMKIINISDPGAIRVITEKTTYIPGTYDIVKTIVSGNYVHVLYDISGADLPLWQTMDVENVSETNRPKEVALSPLVGDVSIFDAFDRMAVSGRNIYFSGRMNAQRQAIHFADLYYDQLKLEKKADKTTVRRGDEVTFTLTITNSSPYALGLNTVTDIIPAGTTYVNGSAETTGGQYEHGTNTVSWGSLGAVPAKEGETDGKINLSFKVRVN